MNSTELRSMMEGRAAEVWERSELTQREVAELFSDDEFSMTQASVSKAVYSRRGGQ